MNFRIARKYLLYQLFAKHRHGHGIHSPFVYDLLTTVIENQNQYYKFQEIETLRTQLLQSSQKITVTDFGAGSSISDKPERSIKNLVKYSAKNAKFGQLLFRLVHHFKPETILEFGTSLGFSTIYLASANAKSTVYTMEGCENILHYAEHNFSILNISNIKTFQGRFENSLPDILKKLDTLDFVFFDGNHSKEPTLNYFNQCLEKVNNDSVFIFDDIHWSEEMEEAWVEIKKNKQVVVTIDLFFMGIVFFRKELTPQNFTIKF